MNKRPFALILLVIGIAGCNSSHPAAQVTNTRVVSSQGLPSGWQMAEALGEHLSIGCPPGWKMRNVTGKQFEKNLEQAGKQSSAAKSAAETGRRLERSNIYKIILSHGIERTSGMSPTVAVMALPNTPGKSFSEVVDPAVETLRNKYAGAKVERVQMPSGEAVKISFEKEATFHPGVRMQTITYYVPDTSRIVVVSAALPNAVLPTLEPEFEQMMQTLRL